ncbi:MAG: hypothetical protein ABJH05_17810 [Fulvivirga sp.]
MNIIIKNILTRNQLKSYSLLATAMLLIATITSCDSLLEVTDPDIVTPSSLESEAGIETLRAGSLGDLAVAMSGSSAGHGATAGLIVMSGLMADEYDYTGTFPTRREGDTRLVQNTNGTMDNIYGSLHRSRASAEATIELAESFGGVPEIESEMQSIAGYVYVIFAETFCAGVPFSKAPADGGELEFGMPQTTDQMFQRAIEWFDDAISEAGSNDDLVNLATVGKARAMLGLGQISQAAAEVSSVPTEFEYLIQHSDNSRRQENGIYTMTTTRRQYSIADGKGGNGIMYRSANDPRTPWDGGTEFGQDDITLYYNQLKYTSPSDPVVLASGIEARLIEAEAAADASDNSTVENVHNTLRASIGLPDLDLTGMNEEQLRDVHFEERAFWLYSTGHRQGDLRRLVRVYNRDLSDVFPWGAYFKGGEYASNVTFPVPQSEANNPNYEACLDTNP